MFAFTVPFTFTEHDQLILPIDSTHLHTQTHRCGDDIMDSAHPPTHIHECTDEIMDPFYPHTHIHSFTDDIVVQCTIDPHTQVKI